MSTAEQKVLRCRQGHLWREDADLDRLRRQGDELLCPECGLPLIASVPGAVDVPTHPPADSELPVGAGEALPTENGGADYRGRFRILRHHARGGLGTVSLAEDEELGRQVALKEMRPELVGRHGSRERFLHEAQITGQLEHPNIVPVYALGRDQRGRPYYAMRFIRGHSLHEAISRYHEQRQSLASEAANSIFRDLLGRFVAVCQAVAYAHSQGIIHRDLKPSNVMLGEYGETIVVDWGVAKRLNHLTAAPDPEGDHAEPGLSQARSGSGSAVSPILTGTGHALGTAPYMAPEQRVSPADTGPAADVYSLGAMLLEILTGKRPGGSTDIAASLPRSWRPLGAIARKAMSAAPPERYGDAKLLAEEIQRWLADEPVQVYRDPLPVRLGRWSRRHRPAVAAAAALLVTALVALVVTNVLVARQRDQTKGALAAEQAAVGQRDEALRAQELALEESRQQELIAQGRLLQSLWSTAAATAATGDHASARYYYRRAWDVSDSLGISNRTSVIGFLEAADADPPPLLGADHFLPGAGGFSAPTSGILQSTFSADGRTIYSACGNGTIVEWDAHTAVLRRRFAAHKVRVDSVAVSRDGTRLLSGDAMGDVLLWDLKTGESRHLGTHRGPSQQVRAVAISADGRYGLSGGTDRSIRIWDLESGRQLQQIEPGGPVGAAAFVGEEQVLSGFFRNVGASTRPAIWNMNSGEKLRDLQGTLADVMRVSVSADGRTALTATKTDLILWDLERGQEVRRIHADHVGLLGAALAPDGRTALSTGDDGLVRLWDTLTGKLLRSFSFAHNVDQLAYVAYAPDGATALVAGSPVARAAVRKESEETGPGDTRVLVSDLEWETGGMLGRGRILRVWQIAPRVKDIKCWKGHDGPISGVAVSPDGLTAVSADGDGKIILWDVATGSILRLLRTSGPGITALAFHPDGQRVLWAENDTFAVKVCDSFQGKELATMSGHSEYINTIDISPDGSRVISASNDGTGRIWSLDGQATRVLENDGKDVLSGSFTPDCRHVIWTGFEGLVEILDLSTGEVVKRFEKMKGMEQVSFTSARAFPKLDLFVALANGMAVRWNLTTGKVLEQPLVLGQGTLTSIQLLPDGQTGVVGSAGGHVVFVKLAGHGWPALRLPSAVYSIDTVPGGEIVLAGCEDGLLRLIDLDRPARYRAFETSLHKARQVLAEDPRNAQALQTFGEWYSFRGVDGGAAEFYEQVRASGGAVAHLTLARAYWLAGRHDDAAREFELAKERREAPEGYLGLCLQAIKRDGPVHRP